jgi:20S proteasome alpha/beta subunit
LKTHYDEAMNLSAGLRVTVKVLKKTLDKNKLSGDNIDIYVLSMVNGELRQRFLQASEIDEHLKEIEKEEAEEKKKEKKDQTMI